MNERMRRTRRLGLAALGAALVAACAPLSLFATLSPKDAAARSAVDVAYGPAAHQRLDVYGPSRAEGQAPAPVAIFFYGGSWDTGRRQDYNWVGRAMASRGFVTLVPDYGLYPKVRYPGFLDDGALAVRWATQHAAEFGGDPSRIVLVGHSAGAYNAAMIALDRRYLKAAGVDPKVIRAWAGLSGPYDFLPFTDAIAKRIFGDAKDLPATQPTSFARADAPPAFLATGENDRMVYPRNTTKLAARLREAGAVVDERHYVGVDHVGMVLALSRVFRGKAPVLKDMTDFLHAHADGGEARRKSFEDAWPRTGRFTAMPRPLNVTAVLALTAVLVSACAPGAPKGVDKAKLDDAISEAIGDPATCVLIADQATGKVVYRYNSHTACARSLPACDTAGERTLEDLVKATAKDGQARALSCYTQADASRGVGWSSGPLAAKGLVYAAMMEGDRAFPGRMMGDRLKRAFAKVGL